MGYMIGVILGIAASAKFSDPTTVEPKSIMGLPVAKVLNPGSLGTEKGNCGMGARNLTQQDQFGHHIYTPSAVCLHSPMLCHYTMILL